jgi:hypothetical protein
MTQPPYILIQTPTIPLVTRQGGGALFRSDVFIEDRVAAGVVGGEDVLVATAVDLMMAKDCQGDAAVRRVLRGGIQQTAAFKAFFSAFVGTFSSHFSRLACGAPALPPHHSPLFF